MSGLSKAHIIILLTQFVPWLRIAVHPSGRAYASGGEDGFVRLHHYDESYFTAKPYGAVGELDDD